MYDVIVIGGGPAGVTAALRAAELGARVALVERNRLGGTCTNDGCVPTRVLAMAARLLRNSDQFEDYGLVGLPPSVDLPALLARTQEIVYKIHEKKQQIHHLQMAGVDVHAEVGEAVFVDPHTLRLAKGLLLESKKFILCVGGHARRLNIPGAELAYTHSDVWGLKKQPASVAIIGAAATGCQHASIFRAFESQVWLLDVAPRIFPGEDELVSSVMRQAFEKRGIHVETGIQGVERIETTDQGVCLVYRKDGAERLIEVEMVLFSVGWVGNTASLDLEAAGVAVERSYVVVDDELRTTAPHIYAAGDVTGRMMLVQSAGYEARIAAENAVLGIHQRYAHLIVPHGGFTDPETGAVGLTEAEARRQEDIDVAVVDYADTDRAVIDGRTEGFLKLIVSRSSHRILGAHVVGEQAVEIAQTVAAGMASGITVEQLANLEIAYPTYTAIAGFAARKLLDEYGRPLTTQWRTLSRLKEGS